MSTSEPPPTLSDAAVERAGEALLARYAEVKRLTERLRSAVEQEHAPPPDALLAARQASLDAAGREVAALGESVARLPEALYTRIVAEAQEIERLERAVRAVLTSRAQALRVQLATVRRSSATLGTYRKGVLPESRLLDRRG